MICVYCGGAFMPGDYSQCVNKPTTNKMPPVVVRLCHVRCLGKFRAFGLRHGFKSRLYLMGDVDDEVGGSDSVGDADILDN